MSDHHHDGAIPTAFADEPWQPGSDAGTSTHDAAVGAPRFDLVRLIEGLPALGSILWLERRTRFTAPSQASIGSRGILLLDHPALAGLDRCTDVTAHTMLTSQGPREWMCFRDAAGIAQNKMFLLPDSDYIAWDDLALNHGVAAPLPRADGWQPHGAFLRGALARLGGAWRARLLNFELQRLPWLRTLSARPPLRISLLGLDLARSIARSESADLVTPLHLA